MKKVSLMIAALALVLGLSQCKKDEKPAASGEKQHIVLTANNGNDGSKVAGEFVADALNLTWQDGDVIDVKGGASGTLTLVDGAGTTSATFEGDIVKGSGETIEFTVGTEPNYLSQTGADRFITDSIYLVGTSQYKEDGNYSVDMKLPHAVLKLNVSTLGTSGALTISVGASTVASVESVTDPSEVFVAVPADGSQKNYTIGFGGKTATKEWTLAANTFYTISGSTTGEAIVIEPDAPAAPEGALSGVFTVADPTPDKPNSGDETKVYFSQGNLQYQASTDTWRFAENQWDYVGDATSGTVYVESTKCNNGQISSSYSGWIDLFGWGTSGYYESSDTYITNYQPWSKSYTAASYGTDAYTYNQYGYGPSTYVTPAGPAGMTQSAGNISGSYYDWGVYNAISNGGDEAGKWRTLTGGGFDTEWYYLLKQRNMKNTGMVRYTDMMAGITISGTTHKGLFIYPDDYNGTEVGVDETTDTWDEINGLGIVFLPAAGYRNGTSVKQVGSYGIYWSSSCSTGGSAYRLGNVSNVNPGDAGSRCYGSSVRLVSVN